MDPQKAKQAERLGMGVASRPRYAFCFCMYSALNLSIMGKLGAQFLSTVERLSSSRGSIKGFTV